MKVLLTTDGSDAAKESIERFLRMCPKTVNELVVLNVDEYQAYGVIDSIDQATLDRLHKENSQRILNAAKELLDRLGKKAKYVGKLGQSADVILSLAEDAECDLIVVGARGNGAMTRFVLGSTSDSVVSHASVPVWVVRPDAIHAESTNPHVTVCYDGSEYAKKAVEYLRDIGLPAGSEISLVAYVRRPENLPDEIEYDEKQKKDFQSDLAKLAATFEKDGMKVEIVVAETRHVGHGIVDFAKERKSSLVVVGDKGRSAIARFFLGSVSRFVLHHAPCSVLVVKP